MIVYVVDHEDPYSSIHYVKGVFSTLDKAKICAASYGDNEIYTFELDKERI